MDGTSGLQLVVKTSGRTGACPGRNEMFKKVDKDILKETIRIAGPATVESFFSAIATFIDSKMVSSLGTAAVASVALTTQPMLLRLTPFTAINIATAALVARRKGEQKQAEANRVLVTSLIITLIIAVIITCTYTFAASPILRLMGSNADTHEMATTYLRIICLGTALTAFQNCINAAHRGTGFTKISMQTHLTSSAVNVCFNYLLINGHLGFPRLEIKGAAIATMIGMSVACFMSVISLFRKTPYIRLRIIIDEKIRPKWFVVKQIFHISWSVFIEQVLVRVGFLLSSKMAAGLGTNSLAAHRVAGNFATLSYSFGNGLMEAAVALVGRSLGEGKPENAKKYATTCRVLGVIVSAFVALLFAFLVRPMYRLFFTDPAVVDIGVALNIPLILVVCFQIQQGINAGVLRGAGDTRFTAFMGIVCSTIIRPAVAFLCAFPLGLGIVGIWCGTVADQAARFIATAVRLALGKWTKIKI